jgi:methylenetetrahydrofolate--tRNA-(uracil-5-)-methyltransferase
MKVRVIGGGLAGCEAAFQLAEAGFDVLLCEQKPQQRTPAQITDHLAELVCSNSFRSSNVENAVGLIKEEMRRAGSFIMARAAEARVPAGDALAVDREQFARVVESQLRAHPRITVVAGEVKTLPTDGVPTLVATGPLTSDALADSLAAACGRERLAFYDAIAPILETDSVHIDEKDPSGAFYASRYGKGDGADYLNCPLSEDQYRVFIAALLAADRVTKAEFEDLHYFEGCLPLEVMAERGEQTLRFGPMKPVGLDHPATQRYPYAVMQLRKENIHGTAYNLVGCQTRLKQGAQREVFAHIPALRDAVFLRYGAIHRNTYVDAPAVLDDFSQLRNRPGIWLAGQITGVEGYVESTASGLLTAMVMIDQLRGKTPIIPPETTAMGGLWRHVRGWLRPHGVTDYGPSNVTWSMLPPSRGGVVITENGRRRKLSKQERRGQASADALLAFDAWLIQRASIA